MKQFHYFNSNDILTKYIKALVSSTNLPLIDFWKPGKPIKEGCCYITNNYIVRCKKSDEGKLVDDKYKVDSIYDSNYFELLSPYIYGEEYRSFTSKFESKYQWYDSDTHKYLGKYLRMLKDFKQLDLMHLYNCVSSIEYNSVRIDNEIVKEAGANYLKPIINTEAVDNDNYKIITCPILYNQDYTIFVNSDLPIKMAAVYFNGLTVVVDDIINHKVDVVQSASFNKPILYRCEENVEDNSNNSLLRNLLTLLIQVPKKCKNIVVLEGDYTNSHVFVEKDGNSLREIIINDNYNFNNLSNEEMNKICVTSSNLIRTISNELHAFDLDLLPHLLLNVIDSNDEISENIERIQSIISSYDFYRLYKVRYTKPYRKGIWDNNLRKFIYDLMTVGVTNGETTLINKKVCNVIGYVDRDIENILEGVDVHAI